MKRKYEEQEGGGVLGDGSSKSARKPRKSATNSSGGIRVSVSSTVIGGSLIPQATPLMRKELSGLYAPAMQQQHGAQYAIMSASGHQVCNCVIQHSQCRLNFHGLISSTSNALNQTKDVINYKCRMYYGKLLFGFYKQILVLFSCDIIKD